MLTTVRRGNDTVPTSLATTQAKVQNFRLGRSSSNQYAYLLDRRSFIYSVSQKIPPAGFLTFFPNGWEFLINFYIPIICSFLH